MHSIIKIRRKLSRKAEEAYKALSASLVLGSGGKDMQVVTVTSFLYGEGKTTTAKNLGSVLARSGNSVLLVDIGREMISDAESDGKRRSSDEDIEVSGAVAEAVAAAVAALKAADNEETEKKEDRNNFLLEDNILKTDVPNLDFMSFSFPGGTIKACTDKRYDKFLNQIRQRYDYIIIDAPALGACVDAAIVAAKSDGTLIVAKSETTHYDHLFRAKAELEKYKAHIIGVVLNQVSKEDYKQYTDENEREE